MHQLHCSVSDRTGTIRQFQVVSSEQLSSMVTLQTLRVAEHLAEVPGSYVGSWVIHELAYGVVSEILEGVCSHLGLGDAKESGHWRSWFREQVTFGFTCVRLTI